jgi:hypothetical protein
MSLARFIATGTKVELDGLEPDEIEKNRAWGITGPHQIRPSSPKS